MTGNGEQLTVRVLGPLLVTIGDREVLISGARRRDVLIRLALGAGRLIDAGVLVAAVWERDAPPAVLNSLQAHVGYLRRQLGTTRVRTVGRAYRFDMDDVVVDAFEFDAELSAAQAELDAHRPERAIDLLRSALARWRGPALIDVVDHSWGQAEIARLTERHGRAQALLLRALLAVERFDDVVAAGELAVAAHPVREELWRSLMVGLAGAGRVAEAGRAFRRYRRWLGEELGLEPSVELFALDATIVNGEAAPRSAVASHLPLRAPTIVGRDQEVRDLVRLVGTPGIVTLVGPGGVGKTRLALEVAHVAARRNATNVWFVDLAPVTGPAGVAAAFAKALGTPVRPGASVDDVVRALGDDLQGLILMDNCEHVVDPAGSLIAAIMRHAAAASVMATSRQPLDIAGERVRPVRPLPIGVVGSGGAVDLFLRCAADAGEVIDPAAHTTVGDICRRLDGLPLAVELAAARVRTLGTDALLASLGERLDGLARRRGAPRHQTLRAAVEWSLGRLSARQRLGFALLSVFAGNFDLRAAEAVLSIEGFERGEVIDVLVELVDRSLVEPVPVGSSRRYRLLETLRHFGADVLERRGAGPARRAHAAHYAALAVELVALATGPEQRIATAQWELELANVRAAFEHSLSDDDIERAAQIADVGMDMGYDRYDFEAVGWAEAMRERALERRLPVAVTLCAIGAVDFVVRGDIGTGLDQIAEAEQLAAAWELPIPPHVRLAKANLLTMHDPAAAAVVYEELVADAVACERPYLVAFGTWARVLALHYSSDRDLEAEARHAVDVCRAQGQPTLVASSLLVLALVLAERDPRRAGQLVDEAAALATPLQEPSTITRIQLIRARVDIQLAETSPDLIAVAAIANVVDAMAESGELGRRWQLVAMAAFLIVHRPPTDVATAVGIFRARNVENNRRQWTDGVAHARAELGIASFDELVAVGAALDDTAAVDFLCGRRSSSMVGSSVGRRRAAG